MTDVEIQREQVGSVALRNDPAGDLIAWARAAQQAYGIAVQLAETSFVPKVMQRRPDEITAAILLGREVGIAPMAALQSINVIEGRPSLSALALRGLITARGHEVWVEESNASRAIVCGQRKGSTHVERSVWTIERARTAELSGKKNWRQNATAMLVARATSEVCRLVAPHVLLGMPYSSEELADGGGPDGGADVAAPDVEQAAPPKRRTVKRAQAPDPAGAEPVLAPPETAVPESAPPPEPVVQPEPPEPAAPPPDPLSLAALKAALDAQVIGETPTASAGPVGVEAEWDPDDVVPDDPDGPVIVAMMTPAQSRRMHAAFRVAGLEGREARLAATAEMIGRELESSSELTMREAAMVIDTLESGWPSTAARAPYLVDAPVEGELL